MTFDELVEKLEDDARIVEIVRRSTPHEHPGWIACPGNDRTCRSPLFICVNCWNLGCQGEEACPQRLFDEDRTCLRCGRTTAI